MLSVYTVHSRHPIRGDFTAESKYIARIRTELHMIAVDPALQMAFLVRPSEVAGNDVAILRDLNLLERTARLAYVIRINGPVAADVHRLRRRRRGLRSVCR